MGKTDEPPAVGVTHTIGLPARPRQPDEPAPSIPDYRFIKVIGRGAFGTVWLAEESLAGVFRAIKVLRPGGRSGGTPADKKAAAARVERELDGIHAYQALAEDHPHLVRILKTGLCTLAEPAPSAPGSAGGPSPSAPGSAGGLPLDDASQRIRTGQPPAAAGGLGAAGGPAAAGGSSPRTHHAVYYVMEIADHAAGPQPHHPSDYEPLTLATLLRRSGRLDGEQVVDHAAALLDGIEHLHKAGLHHRDVKSANCLFIGGMLKLADMGLTAADNANESVGTPGYMPPDGKPDDLYALGKIIYEMTTGEKAADFPDWPADLDPAAGPHLAPLRALINRLCHPNADKRSSHIHEVRRRLTALKPAGRAIRVTRRAVVLTMFLVAASSLLLGGLGMRLWKESSRSRLDPTQRRLSRAPFDGTEESQYWKDGDKQYHLSRVHSPGAVYIPPGLRTIVRYCDIETAIMGGRLTACGAYQIYNVANPIQGNITSDRGEINQIYLIAGSEMVLLYHGQPGARPGVKSRFGVRGDSGIRLDEIAKQDRGLVEVFLARVACRTPKEAQNRYREHGVGAFVATKIAILQCAPASD